MAEPSPPPGEPEKPDAPEHEEEYHLHSELGHELARLGRHPIHEVERLTEEARDGEADTTPGILIAGITVWVTILVVVVVGLVFLAAYLATR
jgi:hypothetical protein